MTHDRKQELRLMITRGERLTQEQDDEAYALFPPEEYYRIPDDQKPQTSNDGDPVKEALVEASRIFKTVDPIAWLSGPDYVDWCTAWHKVDAALASYDAPAPAEPVKQRRKGCSVRCINDGTEYPSITACARAYGVSSTMISNHLNNRRGYEAVRGKKFERI